MSKHEPETRDKIREAAQRRGRCPQCGGDRWVRRNGAELDSFPELWYDQCQNCGHTKVVKSKS